jgi:hypothetical protein
LEFYDTKVLIGEKDINEKKTDPQDFKKVTDTVELTTSAPIWTINGYTATEVQKKIDVMEDSNFYLMHVGVKNYYL